MRIKTDVFKKYANLLKIFYSNGVGSEYSEGVYLDFTNNMAYVQSANSIYARIKFEFDREEDDQISNFYINIDKFINVCLTSEYIELNNQYVFNSEGGTFKLRYLQEDIIPCSEIFNRDQDDKADVCSMTFNESTFETLTKASKYLYKKVLDFPFKGVYVQSGYMFAMMSDQIFDSPIDYQNQNNDEPIIIYNEFAFYLTVLGEGSSIQLCRDYNSIISADKDVVIIMPYFDIEVPPVRGEDFTKKCNIDYNQITFKIDEIALALAILAPYYKTRPDKRIYIENGNDINSISFRFEKEGEIVNRNVTFIEKVKFFENIDHDFSIKIDGEALKKAIEILQGDNITMNINDEAGYMILKSDNVPDRKIILSLMKDE